MVPSNRTEDNEQNTALQGKPKALGSCGVCHATSRGENAPIQEFGDKHGGSSPEQSTACNTCHTSVSTDTSKWPHAFEWKAHTGYGTIED